MTGTVLERLAAPFPVEAIQYRPDVLCRACKAGNCVEHKVAVCEVCRQSVSAKHEDVPYVGHAEVTRRLIEVDPEWTWHPLALTPQGLPQLDQHGGLWIKLVVHQRSTNSNKVTAITMLGYGDPGSGGGPDAVKAAVSDAVKNAAMRRGVALDMWAGERRDRTMVDGTPGLPAGPATDPRAGFWELIRQASALVGRVDNSQINEHFASGSAAGQALGTAPADVLADYIQVLAREVAANVD